MLNESYDFRPLTMTDVPALAALEAAAVPMGWREPQFRECLGSGHRGWVCEWASALEGSREVVAFAIVFEILDEASLLNICVSPGLQGQGLGRRLLERVIGECRRVGMARLLLEVREGNRRAVALYESLGFALDGRRGHYYPRPDGGREDALLYSLAL